MNNAVNNYFNYKITIGEAVLYFFVVMIISQLVMSAISFPGMFNPNLYGFLLPLSFFGGFGAAAFSIILLKKLNLDDLKKFFHREIKFSNIILAVLLYFVSLPMAEYLSMMVPTEGIPVLEELYKLFEESFQIVFDYKIAAFIMVCILAPILEELIFRGLILRGMLQNGINPWLSIVITSLLFGIAHLNPWQFFGAGFLGIIFGFIYWRTQSLWLVIFLHFLNNFIAYVMTLYTERLDETVFEPDFSILGISVVLMIVVFYFYHKHTKTTTLDATNIIPPIK